jgi:hypothetical protein
MIERLISVIISGWFQLHSETGPTKEEMAGVKQDLFGNLSRENIRLLQQFPIPVVNNPAVRAKRSALFTKEKDRQQRAVGRIEKIKVNYEGLPETASLIMNKNISTPYHCAQRKIHIDVMGKVTKNL